MPAVIGLLIASLAFGIFVICQKLLNWWRHQPALTEPSRVAAEYSAEEQLRLQQTFQRVASRYRRRSRVADVAIKIFMICFVALFVIVRFLLKDDELWIPYVLEGLIFGVVLFVILQPRFPSCPACHGRLDGRFGHFCPSCGRRQLRGDSYQAHCDGCGESIDLKWREGGRGRCRRYRIRACTHCGLLVDQTGL
jgi:hypothetical protein